MGKQKLTPKQKLFCELYTGSSMFNATDAARRAGYSKEVAGIQGFENLRKPNIIEYISKLKEKLLKKINGSHSETMHNINVLANLNIQDLYNEDGNLIPINKLPRDVAYAISSIKTIRRKDGEEFDTIDELKTIDKTKMLEMKAKIMKLYEDNVVGDVTINIGFED